jgi:hypothetical protein
MLLRRGDTQEIPHNLKYIDDKAFRSPFKTRWVALVLWTASNEIPGLPYQMMREVFKPYINK